MAPQTIRNMLKDLGRVGMWLSVEGLEVAQINEDRASAFLAARRETGYRKVGVPVRCCHWWPTWRGRTLTRRQVTVDLIANTGTTTGERRSTLSQLTTR